MNTKILCAENIIVGILAHVFAKIVSIKKCCWSFSDYDEIVIVIDNFPTKKTNTIATTVTSTSLINCDS